MKKILTLVLSFAVLPLQARSMAPHPDQPLVQLALLLDTSNSMDGLISQAKSQLWRIVNDLAGARCRGHAPRIEVALYEYGNSSLSVGERYLRQVLPFTSDLDLVSEKLFALRTNGGEEYCGAVINDAVKNLPWNRRAFTYKTIFIAGNEPFTQGDVNYRDAIQRAVGQDIIVNTIFCGDRREGVQTAWKEGADRGRGAYLTINQDQVLAVARSPYDDAIERLGREINDTYVYYGARGRDAARRLDAADQNAQAAAPAGAAVERSLFKSKKQYAESAQDWDVVGALSSGQMKVSEVESKNLPVEWRDKSAEELDVAMKEKNVKREKLQKELERLGREREQFLKQQTAGDKNTLDQAVLDAVRAQAGNKGFVFDQHRP
jgi:hypothetical protein